MGNAWIFPSHSTRKFNKTHCTRKVWEIDTHTFPIVWVLFSHQIPIPWYASSHVKCKSFALFLFIFSIMQGFPYQFPIVEEMQQNPQYMVNLGNWYSHFSDSMVGFFPINSHPVVYFIIMENASQLLLLVLLEMKYLKLIIYSKKQFMMQKYQKCKMNILLLLIIISSGVIYLMQR